MKRIILLAVIAISCVIVNAQAPQQLNYQAVVRDINGNAEPDLTPVTLRFIIHDGTAGGTAVYTEVQTTTTNKLGLVNVQIGSVTSLTVVNWASGPKYLEVDANINNAGYQTMGTAQLNKCALRHLC